MALEGQKMATRATNDDSNDPTMTRFIKIQAQNEQSTIKLAQNNLQAACFDTFKGCVQKWTQGVSRRVRVHLDTVPDEATS